MAIEIVPLVPGFKFECQRCGACCQNKSFPLTLDELTFFNEHRMAVRWMLSLNDDNRVVSVYPCKPSGVSCSAYGTSRGCLVYDNRPVACKLYPFVLRVYYRKPPSYEEIVASLGHVPAVGTIRRFIHQIDEHRWMFIGCPQTSSCPGIGAGVPWDQRRIKRFIADNLYTFLRGRELMDETSQVLMTHFEVDKYGFERSFVCERRDVDEENGLTILECVSRPCPPDPLFGNMMLSEPLAECTAVPVDLRMAVEK